MGFESGNWVYQKLPENYTLKKKSKIKQWILFLLIVFSFACLFNWLIRSYLIFSTQLIDRTMEPNLLQGSRVFFTYFRKEIHRGDIVYIQSKKKGLTLVCRIVGLPQEKIEIKSGNIYINLKRSIMQDEIVSSEMNVPHKILPRDNLPLEIIKPDHYFCIFDNRNFMNDSRSWGAFHKKEIIGVAYS